MTKTFGELLIEGAREALAIHRGELKPARESRRKITARRAKVIPPPEYDAARIREIRERAEMSQAVFADALNVSASTVRAWEQGTRTPEGASRRLLEIAEYFPEAFMEAARKPAGKRTGR